MPSALLRFPSALELDVVDCEEVRYVESSVVSDVFLTGIVDAGSDIEVDRPVAELPVHRGNDVGVSAEQ